MPSGGREESLGSAFTALADDIGFFDYNPAASSVLKDTEVALFHNSWISDSNIETLAATWRKDNLGFGAKLKCFYVPFTEYSSMGERLASNYYSETTGIINISYNFFRGYYFKGLAAGANIKAAWRSIPDYTDRETGELIKNSGLSQSAAAFMADIGILLRFNAGKFFADRDPNLKIGLSILNAGIAITGFSTAQGVQIDDALPTSISAGISYRFIKPVVVSIDFNQPVNLIDFSKTELWSAGVGFDVKVTSFLELMAGFRLKGANPRISLGSEFEFFKMRMNVNYTLDLTSSLNPVNHISLSAKLLLGDRGREEKQRQVDRLYNEGVACFAKRDFEKAIEYWEEALKIDRHFDPAKTGIKNLSKGVHVDVMDGIVTVDLDLNIKYGYAIPEVSGNVQERVRTAIETMTGLEVGTINVRIASVDMGNHK